MGASIETDKGRLGHTINSDVAAKTLLSINKLNTAQFDLVFGKRYSAECLLVESGRIIVRSNPCVFAVNLRSF